MDPRGVARLNPCPSFMRATVTVSWIDRRGTLQVTFELPFLFVTVWS
jgi:hypothetical protein